MKTVQINSVKIGSHICYDRSNVGIKHIWVKTRGKYRTQPVKYSLGKARRITNELIIYEEKYNVSQNSIFRLK